MELDARSSFSLLAIGYHDCQKVKLILIFHHSESLHNQKAVVN